MQLIKFGEQLNCPVVVCLGYFGCMHVGHLRLVQSARQIADSCDAKVALFTFDNNHLAVLGRDDKIVYTFEERLALYESCGVDFVLTAHFDEKFRDTSGAEFVRLLRNYILKGVICGFDYSCGCDRMGADRLRFALSDVCGVQVVDAVCIDGVKVSTTLVKNLLASNRIERVNELLSEPYFVSGKVVYGRHKGGEMGFPTANVAVDNEKYLPLGVYGGIASVEGKQYKAIVNIGQKPTFDLNCITVEAHLIDFFEDLYGKKLKISLTRFLRPIRKFKDESQLEQQLQADKQKVMND